MDFSAALLDKEFDSFRGNMLFCLRCLVTYKLIIINSTVSVAMIKDRVTMLDTSPDCSCGINVFVMAVGDIDELTSVSVLALACGLIHVVGSGITGKHVEFINAISVVSYRIIPYDCPKHNTGGLLNVRKY